MQIACTSFAKVKTGHLWVELKTSNPFLASKAIPLLHFLHSLRITWGHIFSEVIYVYLEIHIL